MQTSSITEEFRRSAAAAHAAWPDRLDRFLVLDTRIDAPIYASPAIVTHLTQHTTAVRDTLDSIISIMNNKSHSGLAYAEWPLTLHDRFTVKMIVLKKTRHIDFPRYTETMQKLGTLDHEIGHLVVKNGIDSGDAHLGECGADAYLALRHIQQFGLQTDFSKHYHLAGNVILGISPKHYTDAVVAKARELAETRDISRLSLPETAELAGELALRHKLDQAVLDKLEAVFRPVADIYRSNSKSDGRTWDRIFMEVLTITQKHRQDPDIFQAGKRFLCDPANKTALFLRQDKNPDYKKIIGFIARHDRQNDPENSIPPAGALSKLRHFLRL